MNILARLQSAFRQAMQDWIDDPAPYLEMIRPAQDPKFGDYQANMAMPLAKQLSLPPREIAQRLVDALQVSQWCESPEIAGPGFINLRLKSDWISEQLVESLRDDRLSVALTPEPRTYVVDFSSPNVAKPMHVGHIRSTVIGDSLAKILRYVGHRVITDNHLGDWGTQFGMIIYGYKHFLEDAAYQQQPVQELGRLYRLVRQLMDYHAAVRNLPQRRLDLTQLETTLADKDQAAQDADKSEAKKLRKEAGRLREKVQEARSAIQAAERLIEAVEQDADLQARAQAHPQIETAVLDETAALHAGDPTNRKLWDEFLPHCQQDIEKIYQRLDIEFDHELGESFYQPWLGEIVEELKSRGLARESEGAWCVFLDDFESPMLVQKRDGAFLYATTDLATIRYRMQEWKPDAILYVVDHRQHEHFAKLFAVAKKWGYDQVELKHVAFGTVMGSDGKPFKTRSGDTVGLEGLLNEAVTRARQVVDDNLEKNAELNFDDQERQAIATTVGIGALKYADLSQNRASDYEFSYDKMLALKGNTAPYLLYPYARVNGIFARIGVDAQRLRDQLNSIELGEPEERRLALQLLRFENALHDSLVDYTPNILANYLYDLTVCFSQFYERCSVQAAESPATRDSRLALCDLVRRTVRIGLSLLGIGVVERM